MLVSASGGVEARFTVGLPAQGRSIMGGWAAEIITQHITRWACVTVFVCLRVCMSCHMIWGGVGGCVYVLVMTQQLLCIQGYAERAE